MKYIRSLSWELIVLASIGFILQNIFMYGHSFYNKYLGFSLLFPLYALFLSWLIDFFKLKNKLLIIFLSILLLAIATFINITLYPIMGGHTGQLYGYWALFFVLPLISIPLGLLYGAYKIYSKKHEVRSCEICGESLGESTFSCPHCGAALTDETQREQITENTYSLTAILKDKNDFQTIKNKLLSQYAPHGYTNKVIDKAQSFMLKNNEIQQSYVSAKIRGYEITLEAFNVERPKIKIGSDGSLQS